MDKHSEYLGKLSFILLHIAQPFASGNKPLLIGFAYILMACSL